MSAFDTASGDRSMPSKCWVTCTSRSRLSSVRMMFSKWKDLNTSRFVENPPT